MSPSSRRRRAAIYTRISVTSEQSVSLDRQLEAAEQYAGARGWDVVGTFTDDGVSATHSKPEDRAGWRALLGSPTAYDVVIVWKVDRLARRVLDFLHADEALQERGAGVVAVDDPVDMTTAQGRAFATVLAVFGELEAAAISARVRAARRHLVRAGRVVGGKVPYGWRSVPNPDGAGRVLAQDPDTIGHVRVMAEGAARGDAIYTIVQRLNEAGVPTPTGKGEAWVYSTVSRILRHPVLAGMTPNNPGNATRQRGTELLRGDDGLPVVDESVAIMSVGEWRAMVAALDSRNTAQSTPRAMRAKTSPILSGLVYCGEHLGDDGEATRMHRGTVQKRHGYYCPSCHQAITTGFEEAVVAEFLTQKGEHVRWAVVEEVVEGGAAVLPEIEYRYTELLAQVQATDDDDEANRLNDEIAGLRKLRREARASNPTVTQRSVREVGHFGDDWKAATTPEAQRSVLGDAIERVWVVRGATGRQNAEKVRRRLVFDWHFPDQLGPLVIYDDATLAEWAEGGTLQTVPPSALLR